MIGEIAVKDASMSHLAILRHSVLGFVAGLLPLAPTVVMAATVQLPAQLGTAQLGTAQLETERL